MLRLHKSKDIKHKIKKYVDAKHGKQIKANKVKLYSSFSRILSDNKQNKTNKKTFCMLFNFFKHNISTLKMLCSHMIMMLCDC